MLEEWVASTDEFVCSLNSLRAAPPDMCGAKNVQVVHPAVGRQNAFATGGCRWLNPIP